MIGQSAQPTEVARVLRAGSTNLAGARRRPPVGCSDVPTFHCGTGFRPDIEGLRAVAVMLVVLYHADAGRIPGGYLGVDVFFVISGFLITAQLVRELSTRGTISITGFYARRAIRLLPMSSLVVLVTLAATWYWLPLRAGAIAEDALASAFYGINYRLARQGVDYFAATGAPTPFQHYWSLSVEEQFYLVWPLLLLVASLVWGRRRNIRTGSIAVVLALLAGASFVVCVWLAERSAPWAYFAAPARAWEMAIGALIAIGASMVAQISTHVAAVATWIGLAVVVAAAATLDDSTANPGHAALAVAGAALIIAGGCSVPAAGAQSILGTAVFQGIGKLSYGWYLWHWPVFVIAPAVLGHAPVGWQKPVLAAGSLAAAAVSYAFVERPIRTMATLRAWPWKGLALGVSLSAGVAAVAVLASQLAPALVGHGSAGDAPVNASSAELAQLIAKGVDTRAVPSNLTPTLQAAGKDLPAFYKDGCEFPIAKIEITSPCVYGDRMSATDVVLFGDSHAGHWFPALNKIAERRHWRLVLFTKSSCSVASTLVFNSALKRPYYECLRWREHALEAIRAMRPAIVVMASTDAYGRPLGVTGDRDQAWVDARSTSIAKIKIGGTKLVMISDTPRLRPDIPECVAIHLADVRGCGRGVTSAVVEPKRRQMEAEAAVRAGVKVVDPIPWFCTATTCPAIVGNILVYRDGHHMSTAYSTLLAPLLEEQLAASDGSVT